MSSLDYEETLRNVAWLAIPRSPTGARSSSSTTAANVSASRSRTATGQARPSRAAARVRARGARPDRGVGRILRTGGVGALPGHPRRGARRRRGQREHLGLLRSLGFRSVLLVPLTARGRTFGVMTLVTAESLRRFDASDREFAEQLAGRAAIAVDNARLATSRRQTADTLQRSLLPDVVPPIAGWRSPRLPSRPPRARRSRSAATSTTSTMATAAGSCCSATSPARASRPPRYLARAARRPFLSKVRAEPEPDPRSPERSVERAAGAVAVTAVCVRLDTAGRDRLGRPPRAAGRARRWPRPRDRDGRPDPRRLDREATGRTGGADRSGRDAVPLYRRRARRARRARAVRRGAAQAAAVRARRRSAGRATERTRGGTRSLSGRRPGGRHRGAGAAAGAGGGRPRPGRAHQAGPSRTLGVT